MNMKKLRKAAKTAALLGLTAALLAGCGTGTASGEPQGSKTPEASGEKCQFVFWESSYYTDLETNVFYRTAIDLFKEQHPEVDFVFGSKGRPEQEFDALTIAFSSGSAPDIFGYSVGALMQPLVESGKLTNLGALYDENGWRDHLNDDILGMQKQVFDGELYALPIRLSVMGVYYRKDLYEKYNLEVPETYEEFINNCNILKENGIVPIANPGKVPAATNRWFDGLLERNCGIALHDEICDGRTSLDRPEVVKSLADLKDLSQYFQEGQLSAEENECYMLLYPGQACHFYSATWQADTFESQGQSADDYGYFRFPSGQEKARSNRFTYGIYVNADSPNQDLAADFLKICASLEPYKADFDERGSIVGVRQDAFDLSKLAPLRKLLVEDAGNPDGSYMATNEMCWPPKLTDMLYEVLDKVVLDEITPEEGAKMLDSAAQEIGFYKN